MPEKEFYVLEVPHDPLLVSQSGRALLESVSSKCDYAVIDAYSDFDPLPLDAERARVALAELGRQRQLEKREKQHWLTRALSRPRTGAMGIRLNLKEPQQHELLMRFGPLSINAEVHLLGDPEREPSLILHDSGAATSAYLAEEEVRELRVNLRRVGFDPDVVLKRFKPANGL